MCPKAPGARRSPTQRIPFSRSTYEKLSEAWCIPPIFLRAVCQQLSLVTRTTVERTGQDELIDAIIARGEENWTWDYGLAVMHGRNTCITQCVCVGLTLTEISLLSRYLTSCQELAQHPLLLPLIILDLTVEDMTSLLKGRLKILHDIQRETGMDRFSIIQPAHMKRARSGLDLDNIMLRLTQLSDWVSAHSSFSKTQIRLLQVVEEIMQQAVTPATPEEPPENVPRGHARAFRQRLDFVNFTLQSGQQKLVYLKESIDAQVQTVYSLIGQKDNRLNTAAAEASHQIADDSRKVAILTRRDSADMRIIALLTMFFLPGTFVSTLFSMQFFSFSDRVNEVSDITVSPKIWLYAVTTVVLTFIVLLCWGLASHYRNREMSRQFKMEDLEDRSSKGNSLFDMWRSLSGETLVGRHKFIKMPWMRRRDTIKS